jgi:hypothetical protein
MLLKKLFKHCIDVIEPFVCVGLEHFVDVGERCVDVGEHFVNAGERCVDAGERFVDAIALGLHVGERFLDAVLGFSIPRHCHNARSIW